MKMRKMRTPSKAAAVAASTRPSRPTVAFHCLTLPSMATMAAVAYCWRITSTRAPSFGGAMSESELEFEMSMRASSACELTCRHSTPVPRQSLRMEQVELLAALEKEVVENRQATAAAVVQQQQQQQLQLQKVAAFPRWRRFDWQLPTSNSCKRR